jgi:hypothetical protein
MSPEILAKLRNTLVELYLDQPSIRRIIYDAGLPSSRIAFDSTAINIWHSVLIEAENLNCIDKLLQVIKDEYGANENFQHSCDEYYQSKKRNADLRVTTPRELLVYSTSKQETRIRIMQSSLEIHLKEKQASKKDRRETLSADEALIILRNKDIFVRASVTKNSGLFSLGPRKNWYYSHWIFKDPQDLRDALETLLQMLVSQ